MSDFVKTTVGTVVDNGRGGRKFQPDNEKEFLWLFLRHNPGDKVIVGVKAWRPRRSLKANGYYFGVVLPMIMEYMGEDPGESERKKEIHATLKLMFNFKSIIGKDDQEVHIPMTTSDLDSKEFSEFLDRVMRWGESFFGIVFPLPEKQMLDGAGI